MFPGMSDIAGVRWYRHGNNRLTAPVMISFLINFPAWLVVFGLGHPVRWMLLVPGVVLAAAVAALAWLPVRAGIGVTPECILVRSSFGDTRAVPWAQVTGFEGGSEKGEPVVLVLTSGGERLSTGGYRPVGKSPAELWQLLRTLEDERLVRTPGAVSALPPQPRPRKPWDPVGTFLFSSLGVIVLIAFGAVFMSMGITEIGPAIGAAHGGGTIGYFIPGPAPCGKCGWLGDFRLPDGTITRRDTRIDLGKSALHTGVPVAARDTGDPDTVFPRQDRGAWHGPVAVLFGASWCWAAALALIIRAAARRLRRRRDGNGGYLIALRGLSAPPDLRSRDGRPQASCRRSGIMLADQLMTPCNQCSSVATAPGPPICAAPAQCGRRAAPR
jgi:hypothetical protein